MANIVITSSTNTIQVVFNTLSIVTNIDKGTWYKDKITFQLIYGASFVNVLVLNESAWAVSFNGISNTLQIDSVNGVAPTSNSDLYDKLIALLG